MNKKTPDEYRQGDVLLLKVDEILSGAKPKKSNVIVEGEATGYAHRLLNGTILEQKNTGSLVDQLIEKKLVPESLEDKLRNDSSLMWIKATRDARLIHEEHGTIEIEIGFYIVIRQREYDEEQDRLVVD